MPNGARLWRPELYGGDVARLLILGGGSFVGWALAEEALSRGWAVTCATRGYRPVPAGAAQVSLDRTTAAGTPGVFDIAAPPVTLGELDRTFAELTGSTATTVWVDSDRLDAFGHRPWASFPLWVPRSHPTLGFFGVNCLRARDHGLVTRALGATLAASLADPLPVGQDAPVWSSGRRERTALAAAVTRT